MGTRLLDTTHSHDAVDLRRTAFDERYGAGAHDELLKRLSQPHTSFAEIAARFGVTRERVRQWHRQWIPEAPNGRERRRLRAAYHEKRRLLLDPVFRAFHRHARAHFGAGRIHPMRSRRGFSARTVRIDHYTVALRDALTVTPRYRGRADFIYFRLPDDEFLFVPGHAAQTTSYPRNSFAAFNVAARDEREPFTSKEHSL